MTGRSIPEWIGKTPDAKVPPRVKVRIFIRYDGKCHISGHRIQVGGKCHISGHRIQVGDKWDVEHVVALCNGGEHRESNLAPALKAPHKIKTAADVREKAKVDRIRKRHLGIKKPRTIRAWRKFDKSPVYASRER